MQAETLLTTLNETLRELSEEQQQRDDNIVECRASADHARAYLQRAKDQEDCAIHDDEEIKKKQRELIIYNNGLSEKSQAILNKINSLGTEQAETYRKRQQATETVRLRQQQLHEAETRLTVAQEKHKNIQKQIKEILDQIQHVNSSVSSVS